MYELINRKHRREPMALQLTAMIDIFSMIVIFLIMGSVFGGADLPLPPGIKLPKSSSPEISATAPTLGITSGVATFSGISGLSLPLSKFQEPAAELELAALKDQLKGFVERLPQKEKTAGIMLNVVSDEGTPYRDVFNAVKLFREAGFTSVLFVATAEKALHR
jgi:biopolymer transport protein ExbD